MASSVRKFGTSCQLQ